MTYIKDLAVELRSLSREIDADTLAFLLGMVLHESETLLATDESDERKAKAAAIEAQRLYMTDQIDD